MRDVRDRYDAERPEIAALGLISATNNKPRRSGAVWARNQLLLAARESESGEAEAKKCDGRRLGD